MIDNHSHIIERVVIDVDVNSIELAHEVKDNSDAWVREVILNALSTYFEKAGVKLTEKMIRLDRLEIEIDVDSLNDGTGVLSDEVYRELDKTFGTVLNEALIEENEYNYKESKGLNGDLDGGSEQMVSPQVQTLEQRVIHSFIHFLDTGTLPWWIKSNSDFTELMEEERLSVIIQNHPAEIAKEFEKRMINKLFILRLNNQFSDELIWNLVSTLITQVHKEHVRESSSTRDIFNHLIKNSRYKKSETLSVLINSIFLREQSTSSNFESSLFQAVWNRPEAIFSSSVKEGIQIFDLIAAISILSNGSVRKFKSTEAAKKEVAKRIASDLDQTQLTSILNHPKPAEWKQEIFAVFSSEFRRLGLNPTSEVQSPYDTKINDQTPEDTLPETNTNHDITEDSKKGNKTDQLKNDSEELTEENKQSKERTDDSITDNDREKSRSFDDDESVVEEKHTNISETELDRKEYSALNESNTQREEIDSKKGVLEDKSGINELGTLEKDSVIGSDKERVIKEDVQRKNAEGKKTEEKDIVSSEQNSATDVPETSQAELFESFPKSKVESMEKDNRIQSDFSSLLEQLSKDSRKSTEKRVEMSDQHSFLAENGGLVLLHPFLGSLFKNLGFLNEKNEFIEVDRAICLLHFLATGNENVLEHHLTFEKYICNVHSDIVVSRDITLTEHEKEEAKKVINSVCEHWEKLNKASVELLQNEFFKRKCSVKRGPESDRVKIEKKGFDILLESLPWGIGIIKFPWKRELIFVEW